MPQSYAGNPDGWYPPMAPTPSVGPPVRVPPPNLTSPAGIAGNVNVLNQQPQLGGPQGGDDFGYSNNVLNQQPQLGGPQGGDDFGYSNYAKALEAIPQAPTLEQPTYQPPKKSGEIIATALAALFPGAPISKLAAGYLQGAKGKSDEDYTRAQQADQQKYAAAEQARQDAIGQADAAGKQYDEQLRLQEQRDVAAQNAILRQEAADAAEERNRIAQENAHTARLREQAQAAYNIRRLQEGAQKLQIDWSKFDFGKYKFGVTSDLNNRKLQEVLRKDNMETATRLSLGQMTADTAASKMALTANMEIFKQAGVDRRFAATQQYKNAALAVSQLNVQTRAQLAVVAKDTSLDDDDKATKTASIVAAAWTQFDKIAAPLIAQKPALGAAFDQTKASTQSLASDMAEQELRAESGAPAQTEPGGAQPNININVGQPPDVGGRYRSEYSQVSGEDAGGPGGVKSVMPPAPLLKNLEKLQLSIGATPTEARYLAIIAANESGGDPSSIGHQDPDDMGLWQINKHYHGEGNWIDPTTNAKEALKLFRASGFRDWEASKDQGQYGGWGGVIGQVPGDPGASRSFMDPGYDYTKTAAAKTQADAHAQSPHAKVSALPTWIQAGIPSTIAAVRSDPKQMAEVEKEIGQYKAAGFIDNAAAYALLEQIRAAAHSAPPTPPVAAAPPNAPASPPSAPAPVAASPLVQQAQQVRGGVAPPGPALNAPPPEPPQSAAGSAILSAAGTAPSYGGQHGVQPLSNQAQALQAQKSQQLLPFAGMLIRSQKPPQVILKLLEGRGLTPENAVAVMQQAMKAATGQKS